MNLEELLRKGPVWRGRSRYGQPEIAAHATGISELDGALPGGGWPLGALTEIVVERHGLGELQLLMPALVTLSHSVQEQKGWILWVAPPFIPYAPALASHGLDLSRMLLVHPQAAARSSSGDSHDCLWAVEQSLRSGSCAAVLAWVQKADDTALRRLQLAAEQSGCLAVLFRPWESKSLQSPAALRLSLRQGSQGTNVDILKCRGGVATTLNGVRIQRLPEC